MPVTKEIILYLEYWLVPEELKWMPLLSKQGHHRLLTTSDY